MACACLSGACTVWYLIDDPYQGLGTDAGFDVVSFDASFDAAPDSCSVCTIGSHVSAITTYGDLVYVNEYGNLGVCADEACSAGPNIIVNVPGAGTSPFIGIAVDSTGVVWTSTDGIYHATLDGGVAIATIHDYASPQVVGLDGPRVYWTAFDDAGATNIRTCPNAVIGCTATMTGSLITGGGATLVDAGANALQDKLAVAPSQVAWVSRVGGEALVNMTSLGGGTTTLSAQMTVVQLMGPANNAAVASDGLAFYWAFYRNGQVAVQTGSTFPYPTLIAQNAPSKTLSNLFVYATSNLVAVAFQKDTLEYAPSVTSTSPTQVSINGTVTGAAATSNFLFMLDQSGNLYRATR
jgi:hypothetical protein